MIPPAGSIEEERDRTLLYAGMLVAVIKTLGKVEVSLEMLESIDVEKATIRSEFDQSRNVYTYTIEG